MNLTLDAKAITPVNTDQAHEIIYAQIINITVWNVKKNTLIIKICKILGINKVVF